MKTAVFARCVVLGGAILALANLRESRYPPRSVIADEAKSPRTTTDVKDLFGLTRVWQVHLEIPEKEFAAMQPALAGGFGPPAPPSKNKDAGKRDRERNLFGTEFPWVEANFTAEGKTIKKIGIRYSGDMTYFASARGLKRPLKLSFARRDKQSFHGLAGLQFHAMPLDPSKAREVLALAVFRALEVPAPRTAFAEVTLTVPGKYDKEYLGLYTVVEDVDEVFLTDRFGSSNGLLMKPFRVRGIDYLGEEWDRYQEHYRPQRQATKEEAKRVIAFARLVNEASEEEFRKQIDGFLDVDSFLRFLAANTLTSNLESFFALGHNYWLYLDPKTSKFVFLPGDLEFALANFMLLGSAEQLMNLSLTKPYPGENRLPDRLLALREVNERYHKLIKQSTATALAKKRWHKDVDAIETVTKAIREKEQKAVRARKEAPAGFGGPGTMGPPPPTPRTFFEKRTASIAAQLQGKSKGFVPQPLGFGPPPGGGFGPFGRASSAQPIDEKLFAKEVEVPPEFEAKLFAGPPRVNYPVAIACEPTGAIYLAVDEQGSLGRTQGGGKILRCVDKDGDGKMDDLTVFARVEHPRGVCYRSGSVWVMHPPTLSVFHDDNGDGVADRQKVLVTGLTTDQINVRGGDHTTNGIRLGIDGWLYVGVGDYGIKQAKGTDGKTISLRGGGIVRVRPDGTELEIFCSGLRNPFDLALDPFLNLFTRDNTNDGAGWDTRVSLLHQTALYGYTQLFANFTDEIMPPLGTFGAGGGTGGLFLQDPQWPQKYRSSLFTGDWGRSEVYLHELQPNGPSFDLRQEVFMKIPRATGMDVDANGRLYVGSWRGGEASVFVGPNVGFVASVQPKGYKQKPFPDLKKASLDELIGLLADAQAVTRGHAQGEILHRGRSPESSKALARLASDPRAALEGRVAALFTLKQLEGKDSHSVLLNLLKDHHLREFALRALTDRLTEREGLDRRSFLEALRDESPRVRAQALISLGRLHDPSVARSILPLTSRPVGSMMPTKKPLQNQPDPDRVLPHLAVRTLVALHAVDACLEALEGPHGQGALWALRYLHDPKAVEGLIKKLATVRSDERRRGILTTLIRLYYREADYQGTWWGIRPDSTGPYYDRAEWAMTSRIGAVLKAALLDEDKETIAFLKTELARHQVSLSGVPGADNVAQREEKPIVLPKVDPNNLNQIGNMTYETAVKRTRAAKGDAKKGEKLFQSQSCVACHTTAEGQMPRGPHLVEIGKRYKEDELIESILKPSEKLAQGYESYRFEMVDGRVYQGFIVRERAEATLIREATGVQRELKRQQIDQRQMLKQSAMPEGLVANLTPQQLADLLAYLQSLH